MPTQRLSFNETLDELLHAGFVISLVLTLAALLSALLAVRPTDWLLLRQVAFAGFPVVLLFFLSHRWVSNYYWRLNTHQEQFEFFFKPVGREHLHRLVPFARTRCIGVQCRRELGDDLRGHDYFVVLVTDNAEMLRISPIFPEEMGRMQAQELAAAIAEQIEVRYEPGERNKRLKVRLSRPPFANQQVRRREGEEEIEGVLIRYRPFVRLWFSLGIILAVTAAAWVYLGLFA